MPVVDFDQLTEPACVDMSFTSGQAYWRTAGAGMVTSDCASGLWSTYKGGEKKGGLGFRGEDARRVLKAICLFAF